MQNMQNLNLTPNKLTRTKRIDFGLVSNIQWANKKVEIPQTKSWLFSTPQQSEDQLSSKNQCETSNLLQLKGPIFNFTAEYLNRYNKNIDFDESQQLKTDESKIKYTYKYPQNVKKLACISVERAKIDKGSLLEDLLAVITYSERQNCYFLCFMMKMTHKIIYNGLILAKKSILKQTEKLIELTTFGVKSSQNNKRLQQHHLKIKSIGKSEDYDHFTQTLSKIISGTHKRSDTN